MKSYQNQSSIHSVLGIACLLLILGVISGCKSPPDPGLNTARVDKTRGSIEKAIDDPERQGAILKIVNEFEQEAKQISEEAIAVRGQIVETNRAYETTREDLQKLYDELNSLLLQLGDSAKQHGMEARKICTEDEWAEITSHRTDVFNFTF